MAASKSKRVEDISRYGFTCNCIACKENWPTIVKAKELFVSILQLNNSFKSNLISVKFSARCSDNFY